MKYKDKYPVMTPNSKEIDCILMGDTDKPCTMCGEPTPYIEICAEAHFCSEECEHAFYDEFMKALEAQEVDEDFEEF